MRIKGSLGLTVEEVEKSKALSALGRSYRAIGRELGRSAHTIKRALTSSAEVVAQVQTIKADLADLYRGKARDVLESISDADISKASLQQKSISSGVLLDKSLLLTGQATSVVDVRVLLDVAHLIREKRDKEQEYEELDPAPTPAPIALPALTNSPRIAIPAPVPVQELHPPTPSVRVKYYTPVVPEKDSENENPLFHGLRTP